jgi:hypothetical protein
MNESPYDRLRDASRRRGLAPGEEAELRAWLAAHPGMESDWESEAGLNDLLSRLPDAPVSTNFTARVLSRIGREGRAAGIPGGESRWRTIWHRLIPRAAFAALAAGLGLLLYDRQQTAHRAELARDLATVSRVAAVPGPELLRDFESIRQLDNTALPDENLLALLNLK